jgi:hypothetical protein
MQVVATDVGALSAAMMRLKVALKMELEEPFDTTVDLRRRYAVIEGALANAMDGEGIDARKRN